MPDGSLDGCICSQRESQCADELYFKRLLLKAQTKPCWKVRSGLRYEKSKIVKSNYEQRYVGLEQFVAIREDHGFRKPDQGGRKSYRELFDNDWERRNLFSRPVATGILRPLTCVTPLLGACLYIDVAVLNWKSFVDVSSHNGDISIGDYCTPS